MSSKHGRIGEITGGISRRGMLSAVALSVASAGCSSSRAETPKEPLTVSAKTELPSEYFKSIGDPKQVAAGVAIHVETTRPREGEGWPSKLSVSHPEYDKPIRTNPCYMCSWKDVSSVGFPDPASSDWIALRSGGSATFFAMSGDGEVLDTAELWIGPESKAPGQFETAAKTETGGSR